MSIIPITFSLPTESELATYQIMAKIVASNPHWRKVGGETKDMKLTDEQVFSTIMCVMLLAREINMSPMQAISYGINNIKGKFEISARGINQLIRQRGHKLNVKILNHEVCKIWGKRKDTGEEQEAIYHIEEAQRANLIYPNSGWAKNPQDMVFARAISRIGRRLFADCIGGFYVEGELQESILKKSVEGIEVPSVEEVNTEKEDILLDEILNIDFPADLTPEGVEKFIEECALTSGRGRGAVIKAANNQPSKFIDAIRKWEDKQSEALLQKTNEEIEEPQAIGV